MNREMLLQPAQLNIAHSSQSNLLCTLTQNLKSSTTQHFTFFHLIIGVSDLSLRERSLHVLQQTGQVLLAVTHHQKETGTHTHTHRCSVRARLRVLPSAAVSPLQVAANHHLLQLHDVGMPEPEQQVDFPQTADGDP